MERHQGNHHGQGAEERVDQEGEALQNPTQDQLEGEKERERERERERIKFVSPLPKNAQILQCYSAKSDIRE